jgi:hypothetical protein
VPLVHTQTIYCIRCACRRMNGKFPYPFMNSPLMDGAFGVGSVAVASIIIMQSLFQLGKLIAQRSEEALQKRSGHYAEPLLYERAKQLVDSARAKVN